MFPERIIAIVSTALVLCMAFGAAPGFGIDIPGKKIKELDISGEQKWVDTGLDVKAGETMKFAATGAMHYPGSRDFGPEGTPRGWRDLLRALPLNENNRGTLIGRIGNDSASRPFSIGAGRESHAPVAGRLFLGLNQGDNDRAEGSFHVRVEIAAATATGVTSPTDLARLPKMTQPLLDKIPTRVMDAEGNPGDRTNFIVFGSESQVMQVLKEAGWTQVNRSVKDAVIQGVLATLSRQAYTQLPMSELMLFGRVQDFGYAQADPVRVITSRHHFRLWKAPFSVDGQTAWVGAGTHDIGLDMDQRNGKLTHKIDPDTDQERDYIAESLKNTGKVVKVEYMTPSNPVTEAKTAHGESFHSDGRTVLLYLSPENTDLSQAFGDLFCSVLRDINPDGGEWGSCSQYIETPGEKAVPLVAVSNRYRILIIPGLMNTCFSGAPAFKEGQEYLRSKYGLTVELLPVPNNSSEDNAKTIAEYLRSKMLEDSRKYIVLGYSKGTVDLQVALAMESGVTDSVAAFISVAGASGGSPVADAIPGVAERWINQYKLPNCEGDLARGFRSLSQPVRRSFLSSHSEPLVPTYSLAAVSDLANTSKMLQQTWKIMSAFALQNDSQIAKEDAIIPGSMYLGSAIADHFAVALPFESSNESVKSGADKNHYPRTALLDSLVRFVTQALESLKK